MIGAIARSSCSPKVTHCYVVELRSKLTKLHDSYSRRQHGETVSAAAGCNQMAGSRGPTSQLVSHDLPHCPWICNRGVKVPALHKHSVGRFMRREEVLCNLSFKCYCPFHLEEERWQKGWGQSALQWWHRRKAPGWALYDGGRLAELVRSQQEGREP